ncbi:uncharacterized protein J3R85_000305 [Psidium guajava]|nr:uncharacterized protein J3R85_000305 [Psidium guajava]
MTLLKSVKHDRDGEISPGVIKAPEDVVTDSNEVLGHSVALVTRPHENRLASTIDSHDCWCLSKSSGNVDGRVSLRSPPLEYAQDLNANMAVASDDNRRFNDGSENRAKPSENRRCEETWWDSSFHHRR